MLQQIRSFIHTQKLQWIIYNGAWKLKQDNPGRISVWTQTHNTTVQHITLSNPSTKRWSLCSRYFPSIFNISFSSSIEVWSFAAVWRSFSVLILTPSKRENSLFIVTSCSFFVVFDSDRWYSLARWWWSLACRCPGSHICSAADKPSREVGDRYWTFTCTWHPTCFLLSWVLGSRETQLTQQ